MHKQKIKLSKAIIRYFRTDFISNYIDSYRILHVAHTEQIIFCVFTFGWRVRWKVAFLLRIYRVSIPRHIWVNVWHFASVRLQPRQQLSRILDDSSAEPTRLLQMEILILWLIMFSLMFFHRNVAKALTDISKNQLFEIQFYLWNPWHSQYIYKLFNKFDWKLIAFTLISWDS